MKKTILLLTLVLSLGNAKWSDLTDLQQITYTTLSTIDRVVVDGSMTPSDKLDNVLNMYINTLGKVSVNEGTSEDKNLFFWNEKEAFPCLGYNHMIWYQAERKGYVETFPKFIKFISRHRDIPEVFKEFTKNKKIEVYGSDENQTIHMFKNREDYLEFTKLKEFKDCVQFLKDTKPYQALFMYMTYKQDMKDITNQKMLNALVKQPGGLFAVMDYVNFKGTGLNPNERFNEQGWGLEQVLRHMDGVSVNEFITSCKWSLNRLIENNPKSAKFKEGWFNRLDKYSIQTIDKVTSKIEVVKHNKLSINHFIIKAKTFLANYNNKTEESLQEDYLVLVDFRIPASKKRLFVINLKEGGMKSYKVAHGVNSGKKNGVVTSTSNKSGSYQTPKGFFRLGNNILLTEDNKQWHLKMHGLEENNDNTFDREVIMHEADYVETGGTSHGCYSVRPEDVKELFDVITNSLLYSFTGEL